ncbi:hypothetical protein GCM10018962_81120 [Dactylosporangium matsuzakiense]|uniref:Uncharacterized protein n=2 Tax=Dactylosporangium TaxID=35753 RepID=A0A9W6KI55_9ACTN|nr:hypothetical protein GCM10017581_031430 [Dactylosporangium matsuzakiense]
MIGTRHTLAAPVVTAPDGRADSTDCWPTNGPNRCAQPFLRPARNCTVVAVDAKAVADGGHREGGAMRKLMAVLAALAMLVVGPTVVWDPNGNPTCTTQFTDAGEARPE